MEGHAEGGRRTSGSGMRGDLAIWVESACIGVRRMAGSGGQDRTYFPWVEPNDRGGGVAHARCDPAPRVRLTFSTRPNVRTDWCSTRHARTGRRGHPEPRRGDAVVGAVRGTIHRVLRSRASAGVHAGVSVEVGTPFGWERYVGSGGAIIGVDHFGASAPGPEVMARYGFAVEHVVATAKAVLVNRHPK